MATLMQKSGNIQTKNSNICKQQQQLHTVVIAFTMQWYQRVNIYTVWAIFRTEAIAFTYSDTDSNTSTTAVAA